MTPGKGTPIRPVRVTDSLWKAALDKAAEEETTVSEHIRDELTTWTGYEPPANEGVQTQEG